MTWAQGAILYCLSMLLIAVVSIWIHGAPMRRRRRRREMIQRYTRMEWTK
jgi:hypothetical protein